MGQKLFVTAWSVVFMTATPAFADAYVLGSQVPVLLNSQRPARFYEFELESEARVSFSTHAPQDAPELDTWLGLYRLTGEGEELVASNDDDELRPYSRSSQITQALTPGAYRVTLRPVRGPRRGACVLESSCEGPGCACLFGEVFSDIRDNPALSLEREVWLRSIAEVTPLQAEQLLRAVQQSSHTDVTTAEEALSRVDQQEVRLIELTEIASGRAFSVFEYGVGDNSYGAFFAREDAAVLASIHDGDLLACGVHPTPTD